MNEAPAKIYVDEENEVWIKDMGDTCYIRADIVKDMADALAICLTSLQVFEVKNIGNGEYIIATKFVPYTEIEHNRVEAVKSALSSLAKYKGETQ